MRASRARPSRCAAIRALLRRMIRNLLENARRHGGARRRGERAAAERPARCSRCATTGPACRRPSASASSSRSTACRLGRERPRQRARPRAGAPDRPPPRRRGALRRPRGRRQRVRGRPAAGCGNRPDRRNSTYPAAPTCSMIPPGCVIGRSLTMTYVDEVEVRHASVGTKVLAFACGIFAVLGSFWAIVSFIRAYVEAPASISRHRWCSPRARAGRHPPAGEPGDPASRSRARGLGRPGAGQIHDTAGRSTRCEKFTRGIARGRAFRRGRRRRPLVPDEPVRAPRHPPRLHQRRLFGPSRQRRPPRRNRLARMQPMRRIASRRSRKSSEGRSCDRRPGAAAAAQADHHGLPADRDDTAAASPPGRPGAAERVDRCAGDRRAVFGAIGE